MDGTLWRPTVPGSTWIEQLDDKGLLKETENTLTGAGQEHAGVDTRVGAG